MSIINMVLDNLVEVEEKRVNSLRSQDAKAYFTLCEETGIKPEDFDLYSRGHQELSFEQEAYEAENIRLSKMLKDHTKQERKEVYLSFLKELSNLGVPLKICKHPEEKKRLLRKYFPGKFNSQGFDNYSPEKLGRAFLGFVDYARKQKNK